MARLQSWATLATVAALGLAPALALAQANCGTAGTPPCPAPEPGSWPLVALALGALVAVRYIRRK